MTTIRPYAPGDEGAVYDVCLKTGDAGQDATHLHTDPRALGNVYVGPYLRFEPELAFVLEDEAGVGGYVLAARDSKRFFQRYVREWLPPLQAKHPAPVGDPNVWSETEKIYDLYHHPDVFCPGPYEVYPAHLHIDLLPRMQGQGWGRRMIETQLAALRQAGAPGVHLGMHRSNDRAYGFYRRLGFTELVQTPDSIYLGRTLNET